MFLLLLAALAAADAGHPKADLVVPEELRKQRQAEEREDADQLALLAPQVLEALGPMQPRAGEWVEYGIRDHGQPEARVRLSVLPPPAGAAEGRYWLEIVSVGTGSFPSVLKLLVHGDPRKPSDIERMIVYLPGQTPLELPAPSDEAQGQLEKARPAAHAKVTRLKAARLQLAAGTFQTEHLRIKTPRRSTQVWLARAAVPLWGLVRSEGAGRTLELLHYGREGAHTLVPPAPGEPDERVDAGDQGNGSESVK